MSEKGKRGEPKAATAPLLDSTMFEHIEAPESEKVVVPQRL
jgi:hypothetical protein